MRYGARFIITLPSLFIFTQQIVPFRSQTRPLANQPRFLFLFTSFERVTNSARVERCSLGTLGLQKQLSLLRSKRTMRRVHWRNCTLGRPSRSGISAREDRVSRGQRVGSRVEKSGAARIQLQRRVGFAEI